MSKAESNNSNNNNMNTASSSNSGPVQCSGGCGFFGSKELENYCSKCFKDRENKVKQEKKMEIEAEKKRKEKEVEDAKAKKPKQKKKHRCWTCNKKIGLLGFECRCEYLFCAKHRFPYTHECDVDVKKLHQDKISEQNTVIKKKKIDFI